MFAFKKFMKTILKYKNFKLRIRKIKMELLIITNDYWFISKIIMLIIYTSLQKSSHTLDQLTKKPIFFKKCWSKYS